jgi:hypothetical protein
MTDSPGPRTEVTDPVGWLRAPRTNRGDTPLAGHPPRALLINAERALRSRPASRAALMWRMRATAAALLGDGPPRSALSTSSWACPGGRADRQPSSRCTSWRSRWDSWAWLRDCPGDAPRPAFAVWAEPTLELLSALEPVGVPLPLPPPLVVYVGLPDPAAAPDEESGELPEVRLELLGTWA